MEGTGKAIHEAAEAFLPREARMPAAASSCFRTLHALHGYWRIGKRVAVFYTDPGKMAIGCGLNMAAGGRPLIGPALKASGWALRVIALLDSCVREQRAALRKFRQAKRALLERTAVRSRVRWPKRSERLSPSTYYRAQVKVERLSRRIAAFSRALFLMAAHLFFLSMYMLDLQEALYMDPQSLSRGVDEIAVNTARSLKVMQKLRGCLIANRRVVIRLLESNPSVFSGKDLYEAIEGILIPGEKLQNGTQLFLDYTPSWVKGWARTTVYSLSLLVPVSGQWLPHSFSPYRRKPLERRRFISFLPETAAGLNKGAAAGTFGHPCIGRAEKPAAAITARCKPLLRSSFFRSSPLQMVEPPKA